MNEIYRLYRYILKSDEIEESNKNFNILEKLPFAPKIPLTKPIYKSLMGDYVYNTIMDILPGSLSRIITQYYLYLPFDKWAKYFRISRDIHEYMNEFKNNDHFAYYGCPMDYTLHEINKKSSTRCKRSSGCCSESSSSEDLNDRYSSGSSDFNDCESDRDESSRDESDYDD
jgi:hypothetical protein